MEIVQWAPEIGSGRNAKGEDVRDYPTEKELRAIRNWKGTMRELWEYVVERWKYPEWGVKVEVGDEVDKLELHTGGWSGNESIIFALEHSKCWFMPSFLTRWERGGHFYFEIDHHMWDYNTSQAIAKAVTK